MTENQMMFLKKKEVILLLAMVIAFAVLVTGTSLADSKPNSDMQGTSVSEASEEADVGKSVKEEETHLDIGKLVDKESAMLDNDFEIMSKMYNDDTKDGFGEHFDDTKKERAKAWKLLEQAFTERARIIKEALITARNIKTRDEFHAIMYDAHSRACERTTDILNPITKLEDHISKNLYTKCKTGIKEKRTQEYEEKLNSTPGVSHALPDGRVVRVANKRKNQRTNKKKLQICTLPDRRVNYPSRCYIIRQKISEILVLVAAQFFG